MNIITLSEKISHANQYQFAIFLLGWQFLGICFYHTLLVSQGRVEELTGIDLSTHAIAAAAEDCSKRLNSYVNSDVLDAIQRSASKPWVSVTPYVKDACMPDLSLLVIDARKLQEFLEAVLWWSKVLNWSDRFLILPFCWLLLMIIFTIGGDLP